MNESRGCLQSSHWLRPGLLNTGVFLIFSGNQFTLSKYTKKNPWLGRMAKAEVFCPSGKKRAFNAVCAYFRLFLMFSNTLRNAKKNTKKNQQISTKKIEISNNLKKSIKNPNNLKKYKKYKKKYTNFFYKIQKINKNAKKYKKKSKNPTISKKYFSFRKIFSIFFYFFFLIYILGLRNSTRDLQLSPILRKKSEKIWKIFKHLLFFQKI